MEVFRIKKKNVNHINDNKGYVIENFSSEIPFSSFLPGISGVFGKPMWVYYVNRGQCIATMGVKDKDHQIMEFFPANAAYRETPIQGFRTFMKIRRDGVGTTCYEPFRDLPENRKADIYRSMHITPADLTIEEENRTIGIRQKVQYCTLPGEKISSLIRKVSITNTSKDKISLELLDGLAVIIPYCESNLNFKECGNSRQAFMKVLKHEDIPYYRLDMPKAQENVSDAEEAGHYHIGMLRDKNGRTQYLPTIVDPAAVFGQQTDLIHPDLFFSENFVYPQKQITFGKLPCSFSYINLQLGPGEELEIAILIGYSSSYEIISGFKDGKLSMGYIDQKIEENKKLVDGITSHVETSSGQPIFDLYMKQTYLDNILRGGYPVKIGDQAFYVYSRKHGDLERDYNFFQVDATYFSQGNADFRDINQNRRNDVFLYPWTGSSNLKIFFNFLQLDGYNPFILKGSVFVVNDMDKASDVLEGLPEKESKSEILKYLEKPFTPGGFLEALEAAGIDPRSEKSMAVLEAIICISSKEELGVHHENYWIDHWVYNNDLLEQYMSVYPDKMYDLLFEDKGYTFYDTPQKVKPRERRCLLTENGVMQYGRVENVPEKEVLIHKRKNFKYAVRVDNGEGEVYQCCLAAKILALLTVKIATLDPFGTGVEMEAGNPGWCDSLTNLPVYFGSAVNETAEIKKMAILVLEALELGYKGEGIKFNVPVEVYKLYKEIYGLLTSSIEDIKYWEECSKAREYYRDKTFFGLTGEEVEMGLGDFKAFLDAVSLKTKTALEKAFDSASGMYETYFENKVIAYEPVRDEAGNELYDSSNRKYVMPTAFEQMPLPKFLEGNARALKVTDRQENAKIVYEAIKKSDLYDPKLGMYRINGFTDGTTLKYGRHGTFPRGCRENESIFLHVEYKYLLELLRCGLAEEFYEDFVTALIPFHDPKAYGRSILENSSFLHSSVYVDESTHGRGYCPRLTGSSAEVLSMWLTMTVGKRPFSMNQKGELLLEFKPALPEWMFAGESREIDRYKAEIVTKIMLPKDTFAFNFLGNILTVYHNSTGRKTFGKEKACINRIAIQRGGEITVIEGSMVGEPNTLLIRSGDVDRIDVYFG